MVTIKEMIISKEMKDQLMNIKEIEIIKDKVSTILKIKVIITNINLTEEITDTKEKKIDIMINIDKETNKNIHHGKEMTNNYKNKLVSDLLRSIIINIINKKNIINIIIVSYFFIIFINQILLYIQNYCFLNILHQFIIYRNLNKITIINQKQFNGKLFIF